MFEKVFKLSEHQTTVKTEVMAGITTFMTMAYILAVNPSILGSTGMDPTAVLLATALASFIGTACMAFMANLPFVLSAGMGLNAYMAYTVCAGYGYSWHVALLAVFAEGLIFIVLSLTNVREAIFNAIPLTLKRGVSVGIGLFIAFIGLQNAGTFSRLFHTGNDHQLPGKFPYRRYLRAAGADRSVYHGGFIHLPCEGRDSVRHSGNLDSRYAVPGNRHLHTGRREWFLHPVPDPGNHRFLQTGRDFW